MVKGPPRANTNAELLPAVVLPRCDQPVDPADPRTLPAAVRITGSPFPLRRWYCHVRGHPPGLHRFAHSRRVCASLGAPRASNRHLSVLTDEEIALRSIECDSIGMGQADAMSRLHAADKIPIASISRDDLIGGIRPKDSKAFVHSPLDLCDFHPSCTCSRGLFIVTSVSCISGHDSPIY
jgi:hypothetical protein